MMPLSAVKFCPDYAVSKSGQAPIIIGSNLPREPSQRAILAFAPIIIWACPNYFSQNRGNENPCKHWAKHTFAPISQFFLPLYIGRSKNNKNNIVYSSIEERAQNRGKLGNANHASVYAPSCRAVYASAYITMEDNDIQCITRDANAVTPTENREHSSRRLNATINFRAPAELVDRLRTLARAEDRSVGYYCVRVLTAHVASQERYEAIGGTSYAV